MKKIKDPALFEKIRQFLTEYMTIIKRESANTVSTVNLRLVHLRRFCRFLMEENILLLSELSAIQKIEEFPREYADGIKYLTIQEMKLVLAQPDPYKEIGLRDRFFMHLLYKTQWYNHKDVL